MSLKCHFSDIFPLLIELVEVDLRSYSEGTQMKYKGERFPLIRLSAVWDRSMRIRDLVESSLSSLTLRRRPFYGTCVIRNTYP